MEALSQTRICHHNHVHSAGFESRVNFSCTPHSPIFLIFFFVWFSPFLESKLAPASSRMQLQYDGGWLVDYQTAK